MHPSTEITQKLPVLQFDDFVEERLSHKPKINLPFGILEGRVGQLLFLFEKAKSENDQQKLSNINEEICATFSLIENLETNCTYSTGLIGFFRFLDYFNTHAGEDFAIEIEPSTIRLLHQTLGNFSVLCIKQNENYDFLHGGLGGGFYFLNQAQTPRVRNILKDMIRALDHIKVKDGKYIKWYEHEMLHMVGKEGECFNFSLSHGMSSIVIFLARCYQKGILKRKSKALMVGCLNYMHQFKGQAGDDYSIYPATVEKGVTTGSRLAWCYGDTCVAMAFLNAGIALDDAKYIAEAKEILLNTSRRRTYEESSVNDPGICHGSIGLKLIYEYAYHYFKDEEFISAIEFWESVSYKMLKLKKGQGIRQGKRFKVIKNTGFLTGWSGLALGLSDKPYEEKKWLQFLLLDL